MKDIDIQPHIDALRAAGKTTEDIIQITDDLSGVTLALSRVNPIHAFEVSSILHSLIGEVIDSVMEEEMAASIEPVCPLCQSADCQSDAYYD